MEICTSTLLPSETNFIVVFVPSSLVTVDCGMRRNYPFASRCLLVTRALVGHTASAKSLFARSFTSCNIVPLTIAKLSPQDHTLVNWRYLHVAALG